MCSKCVSFHYYFLNLKYLWQLVLFIWAPFSDLHSSMAILAMMMMRAMMLIPALEPSTAPASDLQSPKESHRHTVTLTWANAPRTGLPESETSTVTTYSPSSSSTKGRRTAWVPEEGKGKWRTGQSRVYWEKTGCTPVTPPSATTLLSYRWLERQSSWLVGCHLF